MSAAASQLAPRSSLALDLYRAVLLAYLVLTAALSRDFARLRIDVAGLPLFSTELVMGVLAILLAAVSIRRRRFPVRLRLPGWLLLGYLALAAAYAATGLARGFGLAALRDFALVYYLLFFFFTAAFLDNGGDVVHIADALALGGIAGSALTVLGFALAPELTWEHGTTGHVALIAWAAATWTAVRLPELRSRLGRAAAGTGIVLCTAAIYLSAYRTMAAVVVAGAAAFAVASLRWSRGAGLRRIAVATSWFAAAALAVSAHGLAVTARAAALPVHGPTTAAAGTAVISARWVRGLGLPGRAGSAVASAIADSRTAAAAMTGKQGDDQGSGAPTGAARPPSPGPAILATPPTAGFSSAEAIDSIGFRRLAWRNAMARIRTAPLTGIGFGPNAALFPDRFCALVSSDLSNCGNAHNTYLTLAMRMGLPVLAFFVAVNALVLLRLDRAGRRRSFSGRQALAAPALVALLAGFAAYALTGLFLESPYLAVLYWVVLGALAHISATGEPVGRREAAAP